MRLRSIVIAGVVPGDGTMNLPGQCRPGKMVFTCDANAASPLSAASAIRSAITGVADPDTGVLQEKLALQWQYGR
jgi:hypothetical protein